MKYTLFAFMFLAIIGVAGKVYADPQFLHTVQFGDTNSDVVVLQTLLIQHGYLHANATGYFGPLTQAALNQALLATAQPQTSVVTPAIMATLTHAIPQIAPTAVPTAATQPTGSITVGTGTSTTTGTSAGSGVTTGGVSNTTTGTSTGGVNANGGVTTTIGTNMAIISKTVYYKETSADVAKLQALLIQKGFLHANATGYFGTLTLGAVSQALARLGMPSSLSVTPAMMTAIAGIQS